MIQNIFFLSITIIIVMFVTIIILIYKILEKKKRNRTLESKLEELELIQHKIQDEFIHKEIEIRDRQLAEKAIYQVQKNEFISNIADQLLKMKQEVPPSCVDRLTRIENTLRREVDTNIWQEFEVRFKETHKAFYNNLIMSFPHLTPGEKKLATLLRMNLTTKEIATITFRELDTIKISRSRLRKKLGLESNQNIIQFLEQLG